MNDFSAQWKQVDSLANEGLPKSALQIVEQIYEAAKATDNYPQLVKSLIRYNSFSIELEENGVLNAVNRFESEIQQADFPVKPILQSLQAQLFQSYANMNRWEISNRTDILDQTPEDISTWSLDQLLRKASNLYWQSVQDKEQLAKIKIKNFNAITTNPQNTSKAVSEDPELFRPTLFDLLANRAIRFFQNDQSFINKANDQFFIDDKAIFWDATAFAKHSFSQVDTASDKYKALILFQDLIQIHQDANHPEALLDTDLNRLKFGKNHSIVPQSDAHYLAALQRILEQYKGNPLVAEANFFMAELYFEQGQKYTPSVFDETNPPEDAAKWGYKNALEICNQTIQQFPDSRGAKLCANLKYKITKTNLIFHIEQVNLPNTPFLSLVKYRNTSNIYLKFVKLSEFDYERVLYDRNLQLKEFLSQEAPYRIVEESLPTTQDFHEHSVEIILDGLPFGLYGILLSETPDFSDKQKMRALVTQVSNIGFIKREYSNAFAQYLVLDRNSGAPISGVKSEFYRVNYSNRNKYKIDKKGSALTDQNGIVKIPDFDYNLYAKFSKGEDQFILPTNASVYSRNTDEEVRLRTKLFTDRAIYRPGQTVYFKGLLYRDFPKQKLPKIVANQNVTLTFMDANYQEVHKLELVSNEYGSVQGSFTAPTSGLLGVMTINSDFGNQSIRFSVEEYKRPQFSVKMLPLAPIDYALTDTIEMQGHALGFAGNNIDGAKVTYRVERTVSYPWRPFDYWTRGSSRNNGTKTTIQTGELTTDAEGKFKITFPATPDLQTKKEDQPTFTFNVYADVTDLTGETHSAAKSIALGYIGLDLSVSVPTEHDLNNPLAIQVSTNNLDGQQVDTDFNIQVEKLQFQDKYFINRYWSKPDQYKYDAATYERKLPYMAYKLEDMPAFAPAEYEAYNQSYNSGDSTTIELTNLISWKTGTYKITVTANDKNGTPVERILFCKLFDAKNKLFPATLSLRSSIKKINSDETASNIFEPGDQALIQLLSGSPDVNHLYFEIARAGEPVVGQWKSFKETEQHTYTIDEADRGNLFYNWFSVKHNRYFHDSKSIYVPWSNKELKIELGTFRDKLKPGQEEEWQLKISGTQKDQFAAELLATMYDASLDEFRANNWYFNPFRSQTYQQYTWVNQHFQAIEANIFQYTNNPIVPNRFYSDINWFGLLDRVYGYPGIYMNESVVASDMNPVRGRSMRALAADPETYAAEDSATPPPPPSNAPKADEINFFDPVTEKPATPEVEIRTNLNETVFFFPNLYTDEAGNIVLKFTMNEALTTWKFMAFAHTKDLDVGSLTQSVITQKELMVLPNPPRFMREGDVIQFSAKVNNLTENTLSGEAELKLFNAATMESINHLFEHQDTVLAFTAEAQQSTGLTWRLKVPTSQIPALTYHVIAKAGDYSDGEENSLPIVPNRMLVTESLPLSVRGKETKTLELESLAKANQSNSLSHHNLTLEFSSNPAWYAVQALPYIMEFPYECTEQLFNRLYANSLAGTVLDQHPKIKDLFSQWKNTDALLSNLHKNDALKTALLEETPWVLDAQSEAQQKKNLGLLFDINQMSAEKEAIIGKLAERQSDSGGFPWFPGGRDSWYITQYLVEGFGRLEAIGTGVAQSESGAGTMITAAVNFIDNKLLENYQALEERVNEGQTKWEDNHLSPIVIHYLYARSYFLDRIQLSENVQKAYNYYLGQCDQFWLQQGLYQQGLIGLAAHRNQKAPLSQKIINSLREKVILNDELGAYWKYERSYFWYQLPIETHTILLELFAEVAQDQTLVEELKIWLLKNKQTNHWPTTKATAAAVYALFNYGENWLEATKSVKITFPKANKAIYQEQIEQAQANSEPGTGYFKTNWNESDISANLATVKIKNPNKTIAWGGLYWQYFEDLDKISAFEETPLQLKRQLFRSDNSAGGVILKEINANQPLQAGDKVIVRLELRVDRDMEYIHMKDMRASGFEPMNVFSQYKWQGGLGYYESTKDLATHFFFDYLPKGTYVFEYPLRAVHAGTFSNGITNITCMYAPEFSSHSEGIIVNIND